MKDWKTYFEKTKDRERHPLLALAVGFIKLNNKIMVPPPKAADLGCGTGGDTVYLLEEGYDVTAVDAEQEALEIVAQRAKEKNLISPKLIKSPMEEVRCSEQLDLVTSNLALPFISPPNFSLMWSKIAQYLNFGGMFSGQFFGRQHQWSTDTSMTFHDVGELKDLFRGLFKVVHFFEEKEPTQTALQGMQFWHQYDVIAVRIPLSPERPLLSHYKSKSNQETDCLAITDQENNDPLLDEKKFKKK